MSEDFIKDAVDNAPEAGFTNLNYGKLTTQLNFVRWEGDKGSRKAVRRAFKPGDVAAKGESIEIEFSVDVKEFNPALEWSYTRSVTIQKTKVDPQTKKKTVLSDWSEITEPSLIKVFGKQWSKAIMEQPYVAVEDVPNINEKVTGAGKVFKVIRFVAKYKSATEAAKAKEDQYGAGDASALAQGGNGAIPAAVTTQVQALYEALNKDRATLVQQLEQKVFGDYEVDALLDAAGIGEPF